MTKKETDYKNRNDALKNYLAFKSTQISPLKLKDLERDIKRFLDFAGKDLDLVEEIDIANYLISLKKYSASWRNGLKIYLKNFIKWNYPNWSRDFRNLDKLCRTETEPPVYMPEEMLSREEIEKLVKEETSPFWKTFLLVLFYGGFRPSEVCKLVWTNVEFANEGAYISITANKTKKNFLKFVPENVAFYLKKIKTSSKWIFPSPIRDGDSIGRKAVYFRLKRLSKRVLD